MAENPVTTGWDHPTIEGGPFIDRGTPITEILGTDHLGIKNQATQDDQSIGPEPESPNAAHPHKGSGAPKA